MTLDEYNAYCSTFAFSEHVVQWGGSDVWKVDGKLFAVAYVKADGKLRVTFKASEIAFAILQEKEGVIPAPHLASRGMKWLQNIGVNGLSDSELRALISDSYDMAVQRLTKKRRKELGLGESE
ncbi:putative DNA-binding protein (MmcQ/YjbR family) [Litorimonas taeanensis]|uniref:Putative DNA-binding protein (MmcQ/YjbR family) n=1 Tax=Litorimonas taeanensis TaxID=568099 RepID=A0A420WJV2_9PROT|nr:MmcQ/YjbR family DNA-binding protein [Litorimonas taeanensis]RKQ71287.1 putative DNA-binding protein (MmcQ/YjbR family) [Litorimonas taeanensis]